MINNFYMRTDHECFMEREIKRSSEEREEREVRVDIS